MKNFIILATVALLTACGHTPAPPVPSTSLSAAATVMSIEGAATLAPLNSFSYESAPLYTRVTIARIQALHALQKGEITADRAQHIQDSADRVRALLDLASSTCDEDRGGSLVHLEATGQCTKDGTGARKLLAQAAQLAASIQ